jgi:hypothetical protein
MVIRFFVALVLSSFSVSLAAQKMSHAPVNRPNVNLRGAPVVLAQLKVVAPASGKVILRFDGYCISSPGDRIVLAASQNGQWGANDGNVEVQAANDDVNQNSFSHTRSYDVGPGEHTFYAVGQNVQKLGGNGIASVFGSLTAEWFPSAPGQAFAQHQGFSFENIYVEGAPIPFGKLTIEAPTAGKVLVRFDGKCYTGHGNLLYFAASNTPTWGNLDGSTSQETIDEDRNCFSFAHTRTYDVQAGSHTYYAVVENYYEIYGNGFASIFGSLTVQFYPQTSVLDYQFSTISTPFGVNIKENPVVLREIKVNATTSGRVLVNFSGTCLGNSGDQLRLAASDQPNWSDADGCIIFEPYSSDVNRTSFSHTRVYDVPAGEHSFYAVIQNWEEFGGAGLAVVYGSLTSKFYPSESSSAEEARLAEGLEIWPNPVSGGSVLVSCPNCEGKSTSVDLLDAQGRLLQNLTWDFKEGALRMDVPNWSGGVYFLRLRTEKGVISRKIVQN